MPTSCSTSWSCWRRRPACPSASKSAIGESAFWAELARLMAQDDRGVDFITIDGGEGGTGAAPLDCPVGVATHKRWLQRGIRPEDKAGRLANYIVALRGELYSLARACGVAHPSLVAPEQLELLDGRFSATSVRDRFGYRDEWLRPDPEDVDRVLEEMGEEPGQEEAEEEVRKGPPRFPK